MRLYTFETRDGKLVTYAGTNRETARAKAGMYHEVFGSSGFPTTRCQCAEKHAKNVRENGWLVCGDAACAGYIG